jgi:branched-chain amino acid aminotransferase
LKRLETGCDLLGLEYPGTTCLVSEIHKLLFNFNGQGLARLKLVVFRQGAGNYIPATHKSDYYLQISALKFVSDAPVKALIIETPLKLAGPLSAVKSMSALGYVYAGFMAKKFGVGEAIILNQWGRVCEGIHGNIFWMQDGKWFTPPLSEGCIAGVMRDYIMAHEPVLEKPCDLSELRSSEAIYFSNVLRGKYSCSGLVTCD